jgi:hypothetical protein
MAKRKLVSRMKKRTARKNYVYDKKTGRKRRIDIKRSRAAKKGARKRRGKHLKAATKLKISKSNRRARKTRRTKAGRKLVMRRAPRPGHRKMS